MGRAERKKTMNKGRKGIELLSETKEMHINCGEDDRNISGEEIYVCSKDESEDGTERSLTVYFREMGKYRLLTKEEEAELVRKAQNGDEAAWNLFINSNLRLVISVAKHYVGRGLEFEDLIQFGNEGLIKAVRRFDPSKGYRFSTYCTWWIKQSINRGLNSEGSLIRKPDHFAEKIRKYKRVAGRLEQNLQYRPPVGMIAEEMGISAEEVVKLQKAAEDTCSLDDPNGKEDDRTKGELIADDNMTDLAETTEKNICNEIIRDAVSELPEKERMVIVLRYGLSGGNPETLETIGMRMGVTRERIRQIEEKALRRLRIPLAKKGIMCFI